MLAILIAQNRRLTIGDSVLKLLGRKQRSPVLPRIAIDELYRDAGSVDCVKIECKWQSFWSALMNRREKEPKRLSLPQEKHNWQFGFSEQEHPVMGIRYTEWR